MSQAQESISDVSTQPFLLKEASLILQNLMYSIGYFFLKTGYYHGIIEIGKSKIVLLII